MNNQDMINAILASIQADAQLIILLRALITNNIINVPTTTLQGMMQVLNLPTS